jgi:large subunit ribosomal protein L25
MEVSELKAVVRDETETGKGPARRLRNKGFTPAVFYGAGAETLTMSVSTVDLRTILKGKEENVFIKLMIDNKGKKLEKLSVIKELQSQPVSRKFLHADFYEISMDHEVTLDVPLHFKGTAVGVTNGGELLHQKRDLKVSCLPTALPEFIEIDVSGLDIGDSLKVQDITVAKGITIIDSADAVVASVVTTRAAVAAATEPVEEAAPKAPEVIKQKVVE